MRSLVSLVLLCLSVGVDGTALGAIKLDNYTFDKVIGTPAVSVLVKFDVSYSYGEKEDEFKALAKQIYPVQQLLLAEVPVQEYGDKENEVLADRYKLKKDDFPAYFLFTGGDQNGVKYTGNIKADDLATFLRKNGIRVPAVGTIAELDEIVKKFFSSGKASEHVETAKKLAAEEHKNDRKAPMYAKIMEKIKDKGEQFIETETKRIQKILDGKLSAEKKAEMGDKLKILSIFANKDDL